MAEVEIITIMHRIDENVEGINDQIQLVSKHVSVLTVRDILTPSLSTTRA